MADKQIHMMEDGYFPSSSAGLGSMMDNTKLPGWKLFSGSLKESDLYDFYSSQNAKHDDATKIGYWNSADDTSPNYELKNTIDWSLQHKDGSGTIYGRNTAPGSKTKGSFSAKDAFFRMSNVQGIEANDESDAFVAHLYDDKSHYVTLNFCRHDGSFGQNGGGNSSTNPAKVSSGHTGTWLPHVVGFAFRWSNAGSHSEGQTLWPRRVLMHYARDTGGKRNPADQKDRNLISIEFGNKQQFSNDLGDWVSSWSDNSKANFRYTLNDDQFATWRTSFDRSINEIKDKYRFAGFSIELRGTAKGTANKTMIARLWEFRPIVSSDGKFSKSPASPGDYIVMPDPDNFQWGHAVHTGSTFNNPGPKITR